MKENKFGRLFFILTIFTCLFFQATDFVNGQPNLGKIYKDAKERKGKRPIIIIPGILGSELINKETNEKVWFKFSRSDDDDLQLPIATDLKLSQDKLEPGDIIREVDLKLLPDVKVYQGLIDTLKQYGGYKEASWDDPPININDKFFVFPYDWRRDNVETAHLLLRKIEKLRKDTNNPKIKFNILAHSMGGLIARYAAMYGKTDLPKGNPKPNWAGEEYFSKLFFFGTPNEGSADALQILLRGRSSLGVGVDLPFIRNLTPLDIATMPAVFQLLPHSGTERFYDENLESLKVDIYKINTWRKYSWGVYSDNKYLKDFSEAELGRFEAYFELVLNRAKKFHQAINVFTKKRISLGIFIIGGDCDETLDAIVIYKDSKKDRWVTLTEPDSFRKSNGEKVSNGTLKRLMLAPGDGRVTRRSTLAETLIDSRRRSILFDSTLPLTSALFVCEDHDGITNNKTIQNNFLTSLISEAEQK